MRAKVSRYIKHGRIYQATENFLAEKSSQHSEARKQFFEVKKGEFLEFRYECNANFRTVDNIYLCVSQDEFEARTKPYADIWHNVRFRNQNKLKGILNECLYDLIGAQEEH